MHWVDQIILAVDFVNVDIVRVCPAGRPRIVIDPVVAAVAEAAVVAASDAKLMLVAEVLVKFLFADAVRAAVSAVALGLL